MFEFDGKAIRSLMLERQMTIRDVAKSAGVTETTAAKIIHGKAHSANGRTLSKIAAAFGVTADKILRGDNT